MSKRCPSQIVKTTAPAWIMVQSSLCIVLVFLSPWWLLTIRRKTKKIGFNRKENFFSAKFFWIEIGTFSFFPPTRKMILENPFVLNLQLFFSFPFSLILHLPSFYFSFCFDPLFHLCSLLSFKFFNFFAAVTVAQSVVRSFKGPLVLQIGATLWLTRVQIPAEA